MRAICPECGRPNPVTNNFCGHCGAPLKGAKVVRPAKTTGRTPRASGRKRVLGFSGCGVVLAIVCVSLLIIGLIGSLIPSPEPTTTAWAMAQATEGTQPFRTPNPTGTPRAASTSQRAATLAPENTPGPTKPADQVAAQEPIGADLVIAYNPGPGANAAYKDPKKALGEPDLVDQPCCEGMVQLGRGGSILLAFTDNVIVDRPGPDFQIYGESAKDDFLLVEVSADGQIWYTYPRVSESPGGLDLADVGLEYASLVWLTDLQPATKTGAEVDAVVAIHGGAGSTDALLPLADATLRRSVMLRSEPNKDALGAGEIPVGLALEVLDCSQGKGWVKVQAEDGATGWCQTADLCLNTTLPKCTVAQAPKPTRTPTPAQAPIRAEAQVTQVIDGDTIEVSIGGQLYRLRYIGVDSPEPGQWMGKQASEANRALVGGKTVYLEKDVSDTDRYGRLLRYVYLADGTFVNAELVRQGYAAAKQYPPDTKYHKLFSDLQEQAKGAGKGLWAARPTPKPVAPVPTVTPGLEGNCDPSYPTVCIPPPPPDLDCADIPYRRFTVVGSDPHRFDGDHDGIGCER